MSDDDEIRRLRKEVLRAKQQYSRLREVESKKRGQKSAYFPVKDYVEGGEYGKIDATDASEVFDALGIAYEIYGHDDEWSVIKIVQLPTRRATRSYDAALESVGVDPDPSEDEV